MKAAFEHLVEQLKKHKGLLRNQRSWSRRRAEQPPVSTVPFEETMAAMKPDTVTTGDVAGYIDVNLPRLQRFIERELNYREAQGLLESDQLDGGRRSGRGHRRRARREARSAGASAPGSLAVPAGDGCHRPASGAAIR